MQLMDRHSFDLYRCFLREGLIKANQKNKQKQNDFEVFHITLTLFVNFG
ncbi:MAG: hypothetical protein IGBAC_1906 [Ignavibacteriae bacterium]|nr:MAG: hypothetical protein IGBAC_1906 [Ignavibacteriota bacterium]